MYQEVVDTIPSTDIVTGITRRAITLQPYPLSRRKTDMMRCEEEDSEEFLSGRGLKEPEE
jgi:hypothetical protein